MTRLTALANAPKHLAIIMDGNSRWAESRGLLRDEGHRAGAKHVRTIAEACADLGVQFLSLFAFSTENWERPRDEVDFLIRLIGETLDNELNELVDRETKVQFIGERSRFPPHVQKKMWECEVKTSSFEKLFLTIALNYGGRWDITNATREIALAVHQGYLHPNEIDESVIDSYLATRNLPSPDLCIRTGGDRRISNFLLWDFAYTEFYFADQFWPAFTIDKLENALCEYGQRQRRFGGRRELKAKPSLVESN